jgi:hypothetical protein
VLVGITTAIRVEGDGYIVTAGDVAVLLPAGESNCVGATFGYDDRAIVRANSSFLVPASLAVGTYKLCVCKEVDLAVCAYLDRPFDFLPRVTLIVRDSPPSPSPPSALPSLPSPPPLTSPAFRVRVSFVADGDISDYASSRIALIASVVATEARVPASDVTVSVQAASVRVIVDVAAPSSTDASRIASGLGTGIISKPSTLSSALASGGIVVTAVGEPVITTWVEPFSPPSASTTNAVSIGKEQGSVSTLVLLSVCAAVLVLLAVLAYFACLLMRRYSSSKDRSRLELSHCRRRHRTLPNVTEAARSNTPEFSRVYATSYAGKTAHTQLLAERLQRAREGNAAPATQKVPVPAQAPSGTEPIGSFTFTSKPRAAGTPVPLHAEGPSPSLKAEKMLRDRLTLLKSTNRKTHIISCPFKDSEGVATAKAIARRYEDSSRYEDSRSEFCYYPNEDCPQSLDVSWLQTWMAIAKNAKRTGGKVYVVHRCDGKGQYGCDVKGPGSLDGQAQPGEVEYATEIGCTIEWVGYAANQAISDTQDESYVGATSSPSPATPPHPPAPLPLNVGFNQEVAANTLLHAPVSCNSLDELPSRSSADSDTEASATQPGSKPAHDAIEEHLEAKMQPCMTPEQTAEQPAAEAELTASLENLMQAQVPVHT